MYLYGFTTFAGIDKVMKLDRDDLGFSIGDLLQSDDEYFLVLGDEVSFAEQYFSRFPENRELKLVFPGFFSKKHIGFLHWMVAEYYSSYKNVMRYFVSQDIEQLLKKKELKKKLKPFQPYNPSCFGVSSVAKKGQTLVVYPDLWTMFMKVDRRILQDPCVVALSSGDSQSKKNKAFWQIKNGLIKYILVTHAEIFQDFSHLEHIILVDPYKWYYANQQDPRYKTQDVLSCLANIWSIKVDEVD